MVGHSYFMSADAANNKKYSDKDLEFIWHYYILPLVTEYEYDLTATDIQQKYSLSAIKTAAGQGLR
jgi:hypothetical protein